MKLNYKKIAGFILSLFILIGTPLLVGLAADPGVPAGTISNPLKSNDVKGVLESIMKLVGMIGGVVVVFFIILSGYKFVTAGGNESEVTKAKEMFYATIIGGAILLGAGVIATVVVNTVKSTIGAR